MNNISNTLVKNKNTLAKEKNTLSNSSSNQMLLNGSIHEFIKVSEILGQTPFYRKLGAGGVLAIMMTARELNIPIMMALNGGLWTFDGKVTMSTQCMNYMIVNRGHRADVIKLDDTVCTIKFIRSDRTNGDNEFIYSYSIQHAQTSGLLVKDNWKKNRRDMLFNRCLSGGARKFMPDVLMQAYTYEEMCDSDQEYENAYKTKDLNYDHDEQEQSTEPTDSTDSTDSTQEMDGEFNAKYEAFSKKWGFYNVDSPECAYVQEIAEATKKTEQQIILLAMENENRFENGFNKWLDNKSNQE